MITSEKILFVDDETHVLDGFRRTLRKRYQFDTASGGLEALEMIRANDGEPYAAIVSDMTMPEMNGIELLAAVKKLAPHIVRIMLTGNADQQTAVNAVNEGDIFRFLSKPCETEALAETLDLAISQHRLYALEQDLLESTLKSCIKVITEVLSLVNPEAFGMTARLMRYVRDMGRKMNCPMSAWELETMAYLSQIGCVVLSEEVIKKRMAGQALTEEESQLFSMHPSVGYNLVVKIPRLEYVAKNIQYQEKGFDGSGFPIDDVSGNEIPIGARILKAALDMNQAEASGLSPDRAVARLERHREHYDPQVLQALKKVVEEAVSLEPVAVKFKDLTDDMYFAEDIKTSRDIVLICKGQPATASVREFLTKFWENKLIPNTMSVFIEEKEE